MSASKPPTATPASLPSKPVAINVSKVGGKGGKVLGAINNLAPQVSGESVANTLKTLDKIGVKDNIEEKIKEHDHETESQKAEEKKKITRRLLRVHLVVTYLLFYTAIMIQWLTLLGKSKSAKDFFYEFFIKSFDFPDYDFHKLRTIGKIAGLAVSLQIIIFVVSNFIVIGKNLKSKKKPSTEEQKGPEEQEQVQEEQKEKEEIIQEESKEEEPKEQTRAIIDTGKFSKFKDTSKDIKTKLRAHFAEVRGIAVQFYQIVGVLSQVLVIIAAGVAGDSRLNQIDEFTNSLDSSIPSFLGPSGDFRKRQEPEPQNIDVKYAVKFAKSMTVIAVLAIIMTSIMNIITWLADIWEINSEELIVYQFFKYITRLMVCYPCLGDKVSGADEKIDDETSKKENLELADTANKKPQSAEKIIKDAQENALKNPNPNDLAKVTLDGPTQNDLDKISGENKVKNGEGSSKEKKDLSTVAKDGIEKVLGGDEKGKNSEIIDLAKNGVDVATKASEVLHSGEGEKPNIEKLVTEGVQTAAKTTGIDKNPDVNVISQGIKTATDGGEEGKPNVEKLVDEGIQAVETATGADKNPDANIISQGIKTVTEAIKEKLDVKEK